MVEGIQSVLNSRTAGIYTVSENGLLAYRKGDTGRPVVTMLDRRGAEISTFGDPVELSRGFELSPDGKMIAMGSVENSNVDVWALDLTRNLRRRLTFDPAGDRDPLWSPDQLDIVFASNRRGHADLYRKIANGSGEDELLYADPSDKWPTSWSPDGKIVLYSAPNGKESLAIWGLPIAPVRAGSPRNPFVVVPRFGGFGQFSPDGRWIAYISSESGTNELMIIPYPLGGGKWLVAQAALGQPRWRKDGREIFFVSRDRRLMSADLTFESESIEVGRARALFGPIDEEQFVEFGVTGDGQHFFVPLAVNQRTSEPLTLLQNWPATLKQ
jgi:Tol biopolymer transport system component